MNIQQAIEFVQSELDRGHYINDGDCWYSCPVGVDEYGYSNCCNDELRICNCGKEQRDVKLQQLLDYLNWIYTPA